MAIYPISVPLALMMDAPVGDARTSINRRAGVGLPAVVATAIPAIPPAARLEVDSRYGKDFPNLLQATCFTSTISPTSTAPSGSR